MRVDLFDFDLPEDRIARRPVSPRDAARLLVVGPDGRLDHRIFRDLPDLLRPGDLLVVNDTRVIPARLTGRRGKARVEVTLVSPDQDGNWKALARPARKLATGDVIEFGGGVRATVAGKGAMGEVVLAFDTAGASMTAVLDQHGAMPLPPYIGRSADAADRRDYQTVYASRAGAIAAPTAGLHFTDALFARLAAAGVGTLAVTLHVGPGTFRPVTVEDTRDHAMHAERACLDAAAAGQINAARAAGGRIVAVGTTSVRLLESAADETGRVRAFEGETNLFIEPGHRFRAVDMMITNFHLPRSTLFMLVCAFAGTDTMKSAYRSAVAENYRFYSYGDACLLTA